MKNETTITLPLPDAKLSPNARIHWAQKARLVKAHRASALSAGWAEVGTLDITRFKSYRLTFYWPDKRRRPDPCAASRCKAYLDGIADAIGQDDSEWNFDGVRFEIDKEKPRVEIVFQVEDGN